MKEIRFERDCSTDGPHLHDAMEILYVLTGRIGIMHGQANHMLRAEQFLVLNPFEHHEIYREEGTHLLSCYIPYSVLRQIAMPSVRCCSADMPEKEAYYEEIRGRLAVLFQSMQDSGTLRPLYIRSQLFALLDILEQEFREDREKTAGGEGREQIAEVLRYLNDHYMEKISLEDAAGASYVSPGYLSRRFSEVMGMHFSEYVRLLRLSEAARLLASTDRSVTEIAEDCGFANPNTFILNFSSRYGQTPGKYRKQHRREESSPEQLPASVYDFGLLKYRSFEQETRVLSKKHMKPVQVTVDASSKGTALAPVHNTVGNVGYLNRILDSGAAAMTERFVRENHPAYLLAQGVFDDTMHVYQKDEDGAETYEYYLPDLALDAILETGARPWLELGHTPQKMSGGGKKEIFFGGSIALPRDPAAWEKLLRNFFDHLATRYGTEEIRTWRYSITPAFYVSYGIFTMAEYLSYYERTFRVIRECVPGARITGGTFDTGLLWSDGTQALRDFLRYTKAHGCLPDFLGMQDFNADYSGKPRAEVERNISHFTIGQPVGEPAPPSADPDQFSHDLDMLHEVLDEEGLGGLPICFLYWGPTIWNMDLGNDTCYLSAYLVKSCMAALGRCVSVSPIITGSMNADRSVFHGYAGIAEEGIPKAAFHACRLLTEMETEYLARGDGYAVSVSPDRTRFTILLWHYCPPDPDNHLSEVLPFTEQLTIDRYYGFLSPGIRSFQIRFTAFEGKDWREETFQISREHGSAYDMWRSMGSPAQLDAAQRTYLAEISLPGYTTVVLHPRYGEMLVSETLDEHEVKLIVLTRLS